VKGRRGRRSKQLLDDFREKRERWKVKAEALGRILWGSHFERDYVTVVRQTMWKELIFLACLSSCSKKYGRRLNHIYRKFHMSQRTTWRVFCYCFRASNMASLCISYKIILFTDFANTVKGLSGRRIVPNEWERM